MKIDSLKTKHIRFIICILLVSATLIVYWRTANHDFISYDDPFYITENRHVQNGLTIDGVIWAFTNKETGYLHPLTWMSYMLDYELYGLNPMGYHWTNLQFHILNTVLLFLVLNFMTSALWRSAFVAALFALHPLHVESVAWISERKDVLSTFFFILSIWAYVRYVQFPLKKNYFILLFYFILGLMAKPMLVTLPCVFILLDYWPLERLLLPDFFNPKFISSHDTAKLPFLRLISEKIPLFILSGFACFATVYMQQSTIKTVLLSESISLKLRIYNAVVTYVTYIGKMFRPYHLSVFYPYPKTFNMGMVFGCGFLLACISFIIILISHKYPYLITGWFWYLGILFPVIGLIPVSFYSMADRYTYISLIGLFVIISWGIKDISSRWRFKKIILSVSASVILISIMISTWFQIGYWKNGETLFNHAISVTKNNWFAQSNLGITLLNKGELERAISHIKKTLYINPDYIVAQINLGAALFQSGKFDEAVCSFKRALITEPDNPTILFNLGRTYSACNKNDQAVNLYKKALKFKPEYAGAHNNLAMLLGDRGKTDEALFHFYEAIRFEPENPDYHINLANLLIKEGKIKQAFNYMSKGLGLININDIQNINPNYAKIFNKLGKALVKAGKLKKAEIFFYRATQIDLKYTETCRNLKKLKK